MDRGGQHHRRARCRSSSTPAPATRTSSPIIVDNLAQIGIDAVATPMPTEDYFSQLADGACVICRAGWYADYPTYDNFMYDLFHQDSLGGNNHGYVSDEFDALVDEAKQTVDPAAQAELFNQAEDILLNKDIGVDPAELVPGRLRLQQREDQQLPADPAGHHPLGAGHPGRLSRPATCRSVGALRRPRHRSP